MTQSNWFERAPSGWRVLPLFAVAAEQSVTNKGLREQNLLSLSFGNIVRKDINTSEGLLPASFETYQIVERGNIVLRMTDLQNDQRSLRSGLVQERGIITSAYLALALRGMDPRFMAYQFRAVDQMKVFYSMGGGLRQSIGYGDLKRMAVLAPPPGEQRAIADFLDRETARIDAFIAKNEELITLLTERRSAVIRAATTVGTSANEALIESGVEQVGSIPKGWHMLRLSLLFGSTGSGTTPSAELVVDADDADVPWVTTGELRETRVTATLRGVSAKTLAVTPALKLHPEGSLLIAMYGATIGRTAILGVPAASNQAVCALSQPKGCEVEYVDFALQAGRERLLSEAVGGGQPNINQEAVRAFRIPVPPLDQQRAIVRHIRHTIARIDEAITTALRGVDLARERRAALISAAVTGKIDVGVGA